MACAAGRSAPAVALSPPQVRMDTLSTGSAAPGTAVTLSGQGFGVTPGAVVLTGLRIGASSWSDTAISFTVPEDGASGLAYVRTAAGATSSSVPFIVDRPLPPGQIGPYGLALEETGLLGAALLVETDGSHLYGVSGFETLCTYALQDAQPHALRSRVHLDQRVADLRVAGGHLFCVGDHGLLIYRCADLQAGVPVAPAAAVAGGSYMGVDIWPDPTGKLGGLLVALCEHAPRWGSNTLRVVFYQFVGGELTPVGVFSREVGVEERQFAVAFDPRDRKAYVSGWGSLSGANKYLLELSTTNLASPVLQHREETGAVMAGDMDALDDVLWTAVTTPSAGNELFRVYTLHGGTTPLSLSRVITGGFAFGRVARVRIVDRQVTVGCSWYGNRPDILLLSTLGTTTTAAATRNSLDWAFDVTGVARLSGTNAGKVIVADEWGGFLTLDYHVTPTLGLTSRPDYQWVPAAAMTEGLHLAEDRVYVAGRGAGPWSADRWDLADEAQWRHVAFDWTQAEPQPNPVSAVATRRDPEAGMLIAALGHEKAMAWGSEILGLLYRETSSNIVLLAQSEAFRPPAGASAGVSAVWPERDLVFMATGSDGFRAYVIDPSAPGIILHRDCRASGFATNLYSTAMTVRCLKHHASGTTRKLIVGSTPGLLVGNPTLDVFNLDYPEGVPDRDHPEAPIDVAHDASLQCLKWKPVLSLDVRPSGLVAIATSAGVGIFHVSWVRALNEMTDLAAWNKIRVPVEDYAPWWSSGWSAEMADVSFGEELTLYVVKATEGLWRLSIELDPANHTHRCMATAFYPGVECGMDYRTMLYGWAAPDIPTLHHPYGVAADGDAAYVTGWSGKVQRMGVAANAGARIQDVRLGANRVDLTFTSPFGSRVYEVEAAQRLGPAQWSVQPDAQLRSVGGQTFTAQVPSVGDDPRFYRIRVRP